jgi:hypothetical protein
VSKTYRRRGLKESGIRFRVSTPKFSANVAVLANFPNTELWDWFLSIS